MLRFPDKYPFFIRLACADLSEFIAKRALDGVVGHLRKPGSCCQQRSMEQTTRTILTSPSSPSTIPPCRADFLPLLL
jgi:hypothetical protein